MDTFNKVKAEHLFKVSAVIVDQGIVSGARFLLSLLLARYVTPSQYGSFVIAYGVLMLLSYIQTSYVLVPMSVLGPSRGEEQQKKYYGSLLKIQTALAISMALLTILASPLWLFLFNEPELDVIFIAMGVSVFGVQLQEYFRRLLYNKLQINKALTNDIVCYTGQFAGFFALLKYNLLSPQSLFWIIFIFSYFTAFIGWYQSKSFAAYRKTNIKIELQNHWLYGKWLLASMAAQWVSGQVYVYFSASMLNVSAAGVLGACRNLFGIINVSLTGFRNIILPYGSKHYSQRGLSFLNTILNKIYIIGTTAVTIYGLFVSLFSGFILDILYLGQYRGFEYVVLMFAAQSVIAFYVFPPDTGLLLIKKTEGIFKSNLITCVVSLLIALPLILQFALAGAIIGMIVTQVGLVILLTNMFKRERARLMHQNEN